MKIVQILGFASAISSVAHGNEYSTPASDSGKSTMFATNEANRINSGSPGSTTKDHSYVASLRLEGLEDFFCSGTLIASQYILTAGHCIKMATDVVIAHLGTDFGSSSKGEQIKVIGSYRHQTNAYDVGLLKLEKPSMQKTATLCAADGSDNPIGTKATALEWGMTDDGSLSHTLQEVQVSLISNAECNKQYNNNMEGMMCAGYGGVKDSCSGGNGGPLVTADDVLIGFASWRGKCGVNVGIYTRLTVVIDYISTILSGGADSTVSVTQQTPIALSTTEFAYTPTVARSTSHSTTLGGSTAKSTYKESTSAVTLVASTSTTAGALASTTVAQMMPIASDCTFHRHLSEEPASVTAETSKPATVEEMEEVIEQDLNAAEKAKKIVHAVTVEADKELEMFLGDSSKDAVVADILKTKAAAEEEEQEFNEEIREDEQQEEEIYEEEDEKLEKEDEEAIEKEEEEDDTSAKTSDKSSKKTSKKSKAEEEGETEKELEKELKEEKEKEKEIEAEESDLEAEFEEVLEEQEEEEEAEEAEEEEEDEEEADDEDEEEAEGEEEEEEEAEEDDDEAPPPTKKPSKNVKSEEAEEKELAREKRAEEEDEAKGQLDEEFGSNP